MERVKGRSRSGTFYKDMRMPMAENDVIIIGAGIAGLSAAIELAAAGYRVEIVERGAAPGGKMRQVFVNDEPIDAGPTVFTMRWVFDDLLARASTTLESHLSLKRADILARHVWDDGQGARLDLLADIDRSADAIAAFSNRREAAGYRAFCAEAAAIFKTLKGPYIAAQKPGFFDLPIRTGLAGLFDLYRTKPFTTMWAALGRHFHDPRLRQLFGRYATYCGSSPFQAAATLMLVAHVEQDGVYLVEGGMHALARALAGIAKGLGVRFRYETCITKILVEDGEVAGVCFGERGELRSKSVIANADVSAIADGLFGPAVQPAVPHLHPHDRSLSAITWQVRANTSGFPLSRHTVFFSDNYQAEFDCLFNRHQMPSAPTTYVCAQDRDDQGRLARTGPERMLVLINAPATGDSEDFERNRVLRCEDQTFALLSRCGLSVDRAPAGMKVTTPADFNTLFPATGGALYGRASHGWRASFKRPGAKTSIPGLYLAGGSAHPGPGVPMAALSGRLAAERLMSYQPKPNARPRIYQVLEPVR